MDTLNGRLVEVDGLLIEEDTLHIAEKVAEYDPNLRLQYVPEAVNLGQPPFRVVERCRDGTWAVVFSVWQLDDRVLDRIRLADTHKRDIDKDITESNIRAMLEEKRRYREEMENHVNDLVVSVLRSPKDTYTAKDGDRLLKFTAHRRD